ncbi:hypothetical protein NK718_12785 [Alsobacter sp. SYSU M60028]|uniref:Uncharacterized protein n=1 Tax=Alsobacter ponti TaxID=2962936 RepID=A0ABT1LGL2_9HYPH|nr:hypothetical protein [Alsobacter ponti]MCP8939393.1 hypothetical protein [Alsobacter ponti]
MATASEMLAARATAGARYEAALEELYAAYVDLAGLELALANDRVARFHSALPVRSFLVENGGIPNRLKHPVYPSTVPDQPWQDAVAAAAATKLAAFSGS